MSNLPALPAEGELITVPQAMDLEQRVAANIGAVDDVDVAQEYWRRADALRQYLASTEAAPAMRGVMRRIEARIGDLLGDAPGRGHPEENYPGNSLNPRFRVEFRALSRAVRNGLLDYEQVDDGEDEDWRWRHTRRDLVNAIKSGDFNASLGALKGSRHVEWYTPERYIDAARRVLGGTISLDPATSPLANKTVQAEVIYTQTDDGLAQPWHGSVWLNPPYGKGTGLFIAKLVEEYDAGRVDAAVVLINAYGMDAAWFQPLYDHLLCFTDHRIIFESPQRDTGGPANGNLFLYLGPDRDLFTDTFSEFGTVLERRRGR